jgi:hypothetical protein
MVLSPRPSTPALRPLAEALETRLGWRAAAHRRIIEMVVSGGDDITLGTNDLARATEYYDAIAEELGVGRMMETERFVARGDAWRRSGDRHYEAL